MEVASSFPSYSANEPPIHILADDILAYIFLLNATIPEHATTMASSQVCTRWRSIALNYRTIWSRIIDYRQHSLKWIETLLDRSKPTSLDFGSRIKTVYLAGIPDGGQGVLELVFNHIDRLRIFNVHIRVSKWELVCSRFLQLPAPNLEFVHVFSNDFVGHLTHPLFDNHAPNLQNLGLLRCSVDLTSPVLTPLTELYVNGNPVPTVLEWLNILGGMPSLRWLTLRDAISGAPANDICPVIHLGALEMLSVEAPFYEGVTLVDHLIVPHRCGLRLRYDHCDVKFDHRQLLAVMEKKMNSWERNAPNRYLEVSSSKDYVTIANLKKLGYASERQWYTEAIEVAGGRFTSGNDVDPVMTIQLEIAENQEDIPIFLSLFALFEWTFYDTTYLELSILKYYLDDGTEALPLLVDSFRRFVNLEKLSLEYNGTEFPFPLLQQENSVIFPALKSIEFYDPHFYSGVNGTEFLPPVVDFLQWRREQGFPVPKIEIVLERSHDYNFVDRAYIQAECQDTVVKFSYRNSSHSSSDTEDSEYSLIFRSFVRDF